MSRVVHAPSRRHERPRSARSQHFMNARPSATVAKPACDMAGRRKILQNPRICVWYSKTHDAPHWLSGIELVRFFCATPLMCSVSCWVSVGCFALLPLGFFISLRSPIVFYCSPSLFYWVSLCFLLCPLFTFWVPFLFHWVTIWFLFCKILLAKQTSLGHTCLYWLEYIPNG